jgi:Fur family zinc uptake transcriptional regulator
MFAGRSHDHAHCVATALGRASALCEVRGTRLTEIRRQVLELIWRRHEPVGAYELLDELKAIHRSAAPPTIYRALDFLIDQGLVHRIESLNAYVGCSHPEESHTGQFLICTICGTSGELDDPAITAAVSLRAAELGFEVERQTIEVRGRCAECRDRDPILGA